MVQDTDQDILFIAADDPSRGRGRTNTALLMAERPAEVRDV